jgi:hypothetical protein
VEGSGVSDRVDSSQAGKSAHTHSLATAKVLSYMRGRKAIVFQWCDVAFGGLEMPFPFAASRQCVQGSANDKAYQTIHHHVGFTPSRSTGEDFVGFWQITIGRRPANWARQKSRL